jgi:6,7-dimethyl-8-ribityllumazine synthase
MAEIRDSNLLQPDAGIPYLEDACVVIVRTEWNAAIVDALEKGCREELTRMGVRKIMVVVVPGAFEIAFGVKAYWENHKYRDDRPCAFVALGCVLRGGTPHFEYVCKAVTDGVVQLNLVLPVPTIFGVLTVDDQQQAIDRTGGKHGNKGQEAAITALKMISLSKSFKPPTKP